MITAESTLADVCFAVSAALETHGMSGVLTGGSAAALYAPQAYMSDDADFVLDADDPLAKVAIALEPIGFQRDGKSRIFVHPNCKFTVDFPKGPLSVGGEYIHETHVLEHGDLRLRILTRTDCIRDRLAHFYFWSDYTALNAAVGVAAQNSDEVEIDLLRAWTERESPELLEKFAEFEQRLHRALNR
jgi:hypothetical protein